MRRGVWVIMILLGLAAPSAHARQSSADLAKIEATLKAEQTRQRDLALKQAEIEKKLGRLQGSLVTVTGDVQTVEAAVLKLREARKATQDQIGLAHERLAGERESLARLVMALQRLGRLPPEALLARPSAPMDTARSFKLLQGIMPIVSAKAQEVRATLEQLESLYQTQQQQEAALVADQKKLETQRAGLDGLLTERKTLLKTTLAEQKQAEDKAKKLAGKAKDLRDLMAELARQAAMAQPSKPKPALATIFKRKATPPGMPAIGHIEVGFGEAVPGGGTSQGMRIAAASGAVVTAPIGGTIRFAGPFRQYKLLVIIQHDNGEHSLLGGMQELYTNVGSHVVTGEPIGKLPEAKMKGDSSPGSSLYYERRRNGKPVDPS